MEKENLTQEEEIEELKKEIEDLKKIIKENNNKKYEVTSILDYNQRDKNSNWFWKYPWERNIAERKKALKFAIISISIIFGITGLIALIVLLIV